MPSASSCFMLEPLLTMLSDTVQPIEVEEVALIGERDGQMNLSIATLLRQHMTAPVEYQPAGDQSRSSGSERCVAGADG